MESVSLNVTSCAYIVHTNSGSLYTTRKIFIYLLTLLTYLSLYDDWLNDEKRSLL